MFDGIFSEQGINDVILMTLGSNLGHDITCYASNDKIKTIQDVKDIRDDIIQRKVANTKCTITLRGRGRADIVINPLADDTHHFTVNENVDPEEGTVINRGFSLDDTIRGIETFNGKTNIHYNDKTRVVSMQLLKEIEKKLL